MIVKTLTRPTQHERDALTILDILPGVRPRWFARLLWPDSPGWKRINNCGPHGSATGAGMPRAGGSLLWRLQKKGWVTWPDRLSYTINKHGREERRGMDGDFHITPLGRQALLFAGGRTERCGRCARLLDREGTRTHPCDGGCSRLLSREDPCDT